ncbi:hypothetical protein O7626_02865 [Micromonospora sp. WMMD1102]|uniref:hypothetical protein n=1 Tax=Micromonospora sp. WMMD1102 TaxID=3016105 RepID=UPI0024158E76|nr:hypothetical protein [Micromonospora sp. WMMD1102]MDG4784883.1 hypothetical protein [Micromonospora sp. WMMD1102]
MMTDESGPTATSAPDQPVEPEAPVTATPSPVPAPGALVLALLALGWLAAMLWSAKAEISSAGLSSMAITLAAYSLPGLISASLVAGAAVSLVLGNLMTRLGIWRSTPRFLVSLVAGLATGFLAALVVTLSYGEGSAIMVLAGTAAAAATVGGIIGGLRGTLVVAAVVAAGLAVFAVGFALNYFKDPLLELYGFGETQVSQVTAARWFARTVSVTSALAAGLLVFGYLRAAGRRAVERGTGAVPTLRWPAYLIAGAGPGLLLLVTEILVRTAGAEVIRLAGAISEADQIVQSDFGNSRVNHLLLVLFGGALTAIIAFGRTLRPAGEATSPPSDPRNPDRDDAEGNGPEDGARDGTGTEAPDDAAARSAADGPAPATDDDTGAGTDTRADTGQEHQPADRPEPVAGR